MHYQVRPMHEDDIPQAKEIDREAFPSGWTQTDFRNELKNPLAHYIVVTGEGVEEELKKSSSNFLSKLKRFFGYRERQVSEYIYGFGGFWVMADEAHITNIAVREQHRGKGIGELLLMSMVELAKELNTRIVTLEVRISNIPAQNLYLKYGFKGVGLRKGYYTDNKEDALIMSTEDINSSSFEAHLSKLKEEYTRKYHQAP